MRRSLKLLIVGALGLLAPVAAYQQTAGSAEACPYARARAEAAAAAVSTEALPVGVSLFDATHLSPEIFP